ncbi:hypothetical protein G6F59_013877 [Rhizopus arrhizus]|nr:hypothetical protein G6F59_013877 [Rhizopus arrhizus]
MFSACASEVACGITRFTPAAITLSSGPNTTAPNGPPLACSTFNRDSSIASATLASSPGYRRSRSIWSWIQAGRVRWTCAYSIAGVPRVGWKKVRLLGKPARSVAAAACTGCGGGSARRAGADHHVLLAELQPGLWPAGGIGAQQGQGSGEIVAVDPAIGFAQALGVARGEQADGQERARPQQLVEGVHAAGEQAARAGTVVVLAAVLRLPRRPDRSGPASAGPARLRRRRRSAGSPGPPASRSGSRTAAMPVRRRRWRAGTRTGRRRTAQGAGSR